MNSNLLSFEDGYAEIAVFPLSFLPFLAIMLCYLDFLKLKTTGCTNVSVMRVKPGIGQTWRKYKAYKKFCTYPVAK